MLQSAIQGISQVVMRIVMNTFFSHKGYLSDDGLPTMPMSHKVLSV